MKRLLSITIALWLGCFAAVKVTTMDTITGDAAAHQIASAGGARMIIFVCPSTNASTVYIAGDSAVSATHGLPCAAGGSLTFPALPSLGLDPPYDLSTIYYVIAVGDKLSITRFNP